MVENYSGEHTQHSAMHDMVKRLPHWLRKDLAADDVGLRQRAEEALVAMIIALEMPSEGRDFIIENSPLPLDAPATIGVKRKGDVSFEPEIAGLNFAQAVDHIHSVRSESTTEYCIFVTSQGTEFRLRDIDLARIMNNLRFRKSPPSNG